ncbi:MAG TPA: hypothetical protein VF559_04070 [Caulobacteraceae bacterium]|jgi:hypothetical protein
MPTFADYIASSFPHGLSLPSEIRTMFDWLDKSGFTFSEPRLGQRYATVYPPHIRQKLMAPVLFHLAEKNYIPQADPIENQRLALFITTGGDGSRAGLWLDDNGRQQFVHVGSGSGSTLLCTLADDPIDFLRLLAIGYEELCWPEEFSTPPHMIADKPGPPVPPPAHYRHWLETTFHVTIPRTASEIVRTISEMDDAHSDDAFWQWVRRVWK